MIKWLLILLTVVSGSCGDVLCAKGMSEEGELTYHGANSVVLALRFIFTRKLVILGILCDAVGFFSLLALLSVAQLSFAVPATALGFILDTVGARFLLHEHVHWQRWLGVTFVAVGVLLAAVGTGRPPKVIAGPKSVPASIHAGQH
jgi:drug/metabolite transporter (DMT)-like permease